MTIKDNKHYIKKYIDAAIQHGEGTSNGEKAKNINRSYENVNKYFKLLVSSNEGRLLLKEQLKSNNIYVSSWTATLLVFEYPNECNVVLQDCIQGNGIWSSTIKTFYNEWMEGNIKKQY